mgnify:CR=1 FL=1
MAYNNRKTKHGQRGFTLIELLVVISIIGVLMAILLPGLRAAKEQAQSVVCASQLRQLAMAHKMYQQSNEGWIVPATQDLETIFKQVSEATPDEVSDAA